MAGMLRAREGREEEGSAGAGAGAGSLGEPVGDVVSGIIHNRAGPMPEKPQSQNFKNSKLQKTNPPATKSLSTLPPTTPPRNPVSANGNPSPPGQCFSFASGAFSNTSPCFETSNSCISGGMRLPRPSSGVEERELECGGAVGPGLEGCGWVEEGEGWCCGRLDGRSVGGGSVALFLSPRETSLSDF